MASQVELVTKFSFIGSLNPLNQLNKGLDTGIGMLSKLGAGFGVGAVAFNYFNLNMIDAIDQQNDLAITLGVSIQALQEWGFVAQLSGSSAQAYESSIGGLSQAIGDTANDVGRAKAIFEKMGISVKDATGKVKSADIVMEELRQKLKGLEKTEKISILSKLGIDRSMLQMLESSDESINKLRLQARALGITTDEEKEKVADYKDSMDTLGFAFTALATKMQISLTPAIKELADNFVSMIEDNKKGINKMMEVVRLTGVAFTNFGKALINMFSNMDGGQKHLLALIAGIYGLNKALKMSPMGKLIFLITGLILVVDDLTVGFAGGKSVIKEWFESFDIDILNRVLATLGQFAVGFAQIGFAVDSTLLGVGKLMNFLGGDFDLRNLEKSIADTDKYIKDKRAEWQGQIAKAQSNEAVMRNQGNMVDMWEKNAVPTNMINKNASSVVNNNINMEVKTNDPMNAGINVKNTLTDYLKDTNTTMNKGGY